MTFAELEKAISIPRINRYLYCSNSEMAALDLYFRNLKLSGEVLQILAMFEVVFRNSIDEFYLNKYGKDWLLTQTSPKGFLANPACLRTREQVQNAIVKLGVSYNHDRTVASLNFAFWRYCFSGNEFAAGGFSLLKIFPKKPLGVNQKQVFGLLSEINELRNRIAHHEPICFDGSKVSIKKCQMAVQNCRDLMAWMNRPDWLLFQKVGVVVPWPMKI